MTNSYEHLYMGPCCFLTGTIEERIFQRQVSKQGLSGTVVDLGKGADHTSFSTSELRDLFSLTHTPCLTHDLLSCSCTMDGSGLGRLLIPTELISAFCFATDALYFICFLFFTQLPQKSRSRFLRDLASLVAMVTAEGRLRNISACLS